MASDIAVQLYDDPSCDLSVARYMSFDAPRLRAGQFVIIECNASKRQYFGNVAGANRNLNRNALAPTDNTAINQLELVSGGLMQRHVAVKEACLYDITLLKEITNGRGESVRVRPQIAALARPATEEEIIRYLGLPDIHTDMRIGNIIDTDVPICVSRQVMMPHILVAGATGSGKTNTIANLMNAASHLGMCVVVFDHKPDYQHTHAENDDPPVEPHFRAFPDPHYWYIGQPLPVIPVRPTDEKQILVEANELDPFMLCATIFHRDGEELQLENAHSLLQAYIGNVGAQWQMQGFEAWIQSMEAKQAPGKPDSKTYDAIKRKLSAPGRIPNWIKGRLSTAGQFLQTNQTSFRIQPFLRGGNVVVIRVGSDVSDGRQYGLLLSHILNGINLVAEQHKLEVPLLIVIDEAQDIFSANRAFKAVALEMLDRHIRKGRSKRIGYVIGVQSADAVPESILNNLNSRIIHRHNSFEQVRVAANMATEDQRRMTNTFGPGEALVFLIGSNSIVHAQMLRAPFKLTKEQL
jgi:Helicase HerA, central domain